MKERYNIEISDIQLSVVSDEPEDFVNSIVEKINERVNPFIFFVNNVPQKYTVSRNKSIKSIFFLK